MLLKYTVSSVRSIHKKGTSVYFLESVDCVISDFVFFIFYRVNFLLDSASTACPMQRVLSSYTARVCFHCVHGRRFVGGQGDMSPLLFEVEGTPCVLSPLLSGVDIFL